VLSAQCSQDAPMLGSWLKLARLLWLGRLRMVVRSASTGSALPIASLHIHPASRTATQLGLLLVHCEIAFPFQPFAPLTCAMHDSWTASLRLRRKSESVSKIIVLVSIESGRVQVLLGRGLSKRTNLSRLQEMHESTPESGHAVCALHNIGSTASFLRTVVPCTNYARTLDALGCTEVPTLRMPKMTRRRTCRVGFG